jgi:hypothetical protein
MALGSDIWTAILTGAGALATALGAGFVWWQVSSAAASLYASNSYAVQKDLIEAFVQVIHGLDDLQPTSSGVTDQSELRAALKRDVIYFDTLVESIHGLRNNGGISVDTWKHILGNICKNFDATAYVIKNVPLPATKSACQESPTFWKPPEK